MAESPSKSIEDLDGRSRLRALSGMMFPNQFTLDAF